jgi:hypothetical protein
MASTVYFVGAGLTKSLQLSRRVPLMMDFCDVMADYVDNDVVLNALVQMEFAHVYDSACNPCEQFAESLKDVPTATPGERARFAALVQSRRPESIERLLDRAASLSQSDVWASGLPTLFRYAINQVFSMIGWDLRLDMLERFLARQLADKSRSHIFVSFNYDLALDRSIERSSRGLWQPRDGYGFEFLFYTIQDTASDSPNGSAGASSTQSLPRSSSEIKILKPHGSLNWLMRKIKSSEGVELGDPSRMVVPLDRKSEIRYWPSPHTFNFITGTDEWPRDFAILIAPPLPNKPVVMKQTLTSEAEALGDADEIYVIGYSFPPTDSDQQNLVREAVRQTKIKGLTVVNRGESSLYFERIGDLFGVADTKMRRFNAGFEDFEQT